MARDTFQVVAAVGILLVPVAIGVSTWTLVRESRAGRAENLAAAEMIKKQFEFERASTWLRLEDTVSNCYADNTSVTCTVTNVRNEAITTCLEGKLTQKKASGVKLLSLVICTGRLGPRETRNASAPWLGGFAKDVCHSSDGNGHEYLDWQACDFSASAVDLPALELAAKRQK